MMHHRQTTTAQAAAHQRANETVDVAHEISKILDCGLDRQTLAVVVAMIENGVDPEACAMVVKELKREAKKLRASRAEARRRRRRIRG